MPVHPVVADKCQPLAAQEKKLDVHKSQHDSASEDAEQQKEISSKSDPSRSWLGILVYRSNPFAAVKILAKKIIN